MHHASAVVVGSVSGLHRYPVKSMLGETLASARVTVKGIAGDRAYALVDAGDGKVATAKNPRKWPTLFAFSAAYDSAPKAGEIPPVRITLPDGATVSSEDDGIDERLSGAVERAVRLTARAGAAADSATSEEYWPDMDGLDNRDTVTDFHLPAGTFFDASVLHILTSATLAKLQDAYSQGRFDERRFRPNVIITPTAQSVGFVENDWVGRTLKIGDRVRVKITDPCGRCVMATLGQGDLPADPGILRTAAQQNHAHVGVYAEVLQDGEIHDGDTVILED
jgi:uncharacterized protein YcbX